MTESQNLDLNTVSGSTESDVYDRFLSFHGYVDASPLQDRTFAGKALPTNDILSLAFDVVTQNKTKIYEPYVRWVERGVEKLKERAVPCATKALEQTKDGTLIKTLLAVDLAVGVDVAADLPVDLAVAVAVAVADPNGACDWAQPAR